MNMKSLTSSFILTAVAAATFFFGLASSVCPPSLRLPEILVDLALVLFIVAFIQNVRISKNRLSGRLAAAIILGLLQLGSVAIIAWVTAITPPATR